MKMTHKKNVRNIIDLIMVAIAFSGIGVVVYQSLEDKQNQDLRILAVSFLPLFMSNIVMALWTNETIISGIPKSIKKQENPELFWSIVLFHIVFSLFLSGYLVLKGLPW